jgi:hypothetical protein
VSPEDVIVYKLRHGNLRFENRATFVKYLSVLREMGFIDVRLSNAQPKHFDAKYDSISVRVIANTEYDDIGYRRGTKSFGCYLVPFDIIVRANETTHIKDLLR